MNYTPPACKRQLVEFTIIGEVSSDTTTKCTTNSSGDDKYANNRKKYARWNRDGGEYYTE